MSDKHVSNLVMLVARLVQQVKRFDSDNDVAKKALDYLQREDLTPSILREMTPALPDICLVPSGADGCCGDPAVGEHNGTRMCQWHLDKAKPLTPSEATR